ncbi:hypothetical protein [Mesobacterium pallidum]|uniref:hypothetical protein n=1 Tax=Mesobacterium pallidum TaxID=2872037 RepID=UPI001EE2ACF2|nr:hypothetical protein [Mesobacterium pallidum]
MARVLGYCLTLNTSSAWTGFALATSARLTVPERVALSFAALSSLPDETAKATAAAVLEGAGEPLPPFLGGMEDARTWAAWATPEERKAYALAAFEAMPPQDQAAFFRHIGTLELAA